MRSGAFTLSAWLEPAASIGGDTCDYSLGRDALHLSVTDAMGPGVASALTATLCVGGLRKARRRGDSRLGQTVAGNRALFEHTTGENFATGVVGRLDLATGTLAVVNAGHVAPYLCRAGTAAPVVLPVNLPFGMFANTVYQATSIALQPGDRLVMVMDGMLEREASALNLITAIEQTRALHPREATRSLTDMVLAVSGAALADDATLLVLDWHGGHGTNRHTSSGAEQLRASTASHPHGMHRP